MSLGRRDAPSWRGRPSVRRPASEARARRPAARDGCTGRLRGAPSRVRRRTGLLRLGGLGSARSLAVVARCSRSRVGARARCRPAGRPRGRSYDWSRWQTSAEKILVAPAWPYAAGHRHLGHVAGFGVPSDVFARYHRLRGNDVLMVSGTDEHGTPVMVAADREGKSYA